MDAKSKASFDCFDLVDITHVGDLIRIALCLTNCTEDFSTSTSISMTSFAFEPSHASVERNNSVSALSLLLLDGLDRSAFEAFCRLGHKQHAHKRNRDHELKFTEYEPWIARAWKDAQHLGLDRRKPIEILDIGTGPGYFPYVCRRLGHRCVGLDLPIGFPFWKQIHEWL